MWLGTFLFNAVHLNYSHLYFCIRVLIKCLLCLLDSSGQVAGQDKQRLRQTGRLRVDRTGQAKAQHRRQRCQRDLQRRAERQHKSRLGHQSMRCPRRSSPSPLSAGLPVVGGSSQNSVPFLTASTVVTLLASALLSRTPTLQSASLTALGPRRRKRPALQEEVLPQQEVSTQGQMGLAQRSRRGSRVVLIKIESSMNFQ